MSQQSYADQAITAWGVLAHEYSDETPTPRNIASDLHVYINGVLTFRSIGDCRAMWRESIRRYPDWQNTILQEFGDDFGACVVWSSTANRGKSAEEMISTSGVTFLEAEEGVIHTAKFFFDPASQRNTHYGNIFELRAV